ncbi:MAG: hypothetical protein DRN15_08015 [Thermoprotei archaeon]|nr:MAG: hypothetical protein DRN15_08015 [Thermoprotei archaeon]RLF23687.1 MAG: hypothetical protein DRM97_04490 [Thermoprotei archaeon]
MPERIDSVLKELVTLDSALAHVKRIAIVLLLVLEGPMSMGMLSKALGIPLNTLDTHLRKLEEGNIIVRRKFLTPVGPRTYVLLTKEGLDKINKLLSLIERLKVRISVSQEVS